MPAKVTRDLLLDHLGDEAPEGHGYKREVIEAHRWGEVDELHRQEHLGDQYADTTHYHGEDKRRRT